MEPTLTEGRIQIDVHPDAYWRLFTQNCNLRFRVWSYSAFKLKPVDARTRNQRRTRSTRFKQEQERTWRVRSEERKAPFCPRYYLSWGGASLARADDKSQPEGNLYPAMRYPAPVWRAAPNRKSVSFPLIVMQLFFPHERSCSANKQTINNVAH